MSTRERTVRQSAARPTLVGAVFDGRQTAAAAATALRESGLADQHMVTAVWSDDRYVIESHAGTNMRRAILEGAAIGAVLGTVVVWIFVLVVSSISVPGALLIGSAGGGSLGLFAGAYAGFNRYRPQLWDEEDWSHLDLAEGEVLLVAAERNRIQETADRLRSHGGRLVEPHRPR